jgi:hypothetical protein
MTRRFPLAQPRGRSDESVMNSPVANRNRDALELTSLKDVVSVSIHRNPYGSVANLRSHSNSLQQQQHFVLSSHLDLCNDTLDEPR